MIPQQLLIHLASPHKLDYIKGEMKVSAYTWMKVTLHSMVLCKEYLILGSCIIFPLKCLFTCNPVCKTPLKNQLFKDFLQNVPWSLAAKHEDLSEIKIDFPYMSSPHSQPFWENVPTKETTQKLQNSKKKKHEVFFVKDTLFCFWSFKAAKKKIWVLTLQPSPMCLGLVAIDLHHLSISDGESQDSPPSDFDDVEGFFFLKHLFQHRETSLKEQKTS